MKTKSLGILFLIFLHASAFAMVEANGIEISPPNPFQMIVNRPFLFLIEDSLTGTILFMGVVFDPQTN